MPSTVQEDSTPDAGVPSAGVVNVGEVSVLLVRVSEPAKVLKVPVVGKVTFVVPVKVLVYAKLPEPVTVIAALFATPVPPLAAATVPANVIVPEVVIGLPLTVSPVVPPEIATLVTVPVAVPAGVLQTPSPRQKVVALADVPLLRLPTGKLPVTLVAKLTKVVDVVPVPPLAIGSVPVTPVVSGSPVALVNTAADGVPRFGVTNVGLVAKTAEPEPVSSVNAAAKLALEGVPKKVAMPEPKLVIPVPPLATANVPATVTAPDVAVLGVKPVEPKSIVVTPSATLEATLT